jgi:hypothetical protein
MRHLSAVVCAIAISAMAACGGGAYPSSPTPVSVGASGTFDYYDDYPPPDPYDPYPPAPAPPPQQGALTIAPIYGPGAGGTEVTITGSDFADGAAVMFGTAAATSVTVASSTTIMAMTPPAADGPVDVVVMNPGGSMFSLPGGFTYAAEPPPGGVATITITPAGASPKAIQVAAGSRVRFVNNDARPHDMRSDPHPAHTDCPGLNEAGFLVPGASAQTGVFALPGSCGFHDHNDGANPAWMGRIIIR